MINVLFVCLGNICRSPLAEGIFNHLIQQQGLSNKLSCDSCGTSNYHIGEMPHRLSRWVAHEHGQELTHRARQLHSGDFKDFHYIIAMDASNVQNMRYISGFGGTAAKIFLMREFDSRKSGLAVADPYGGDEADFEECYQVLEESCSNFLRYLMQEHGLNQ